MTDSQSHGNPERRRQLLEAARSRFVALGYAKTPVSAIVKDAGVSQGTFYLYFASKQAVLVDLRREVFGEYARTLASVAALPIPADERMARVVWAMVEVVGKNLELERVFRHAESAEATLLAAREGRARLASVASGWLEAGTREGTFRCADPEATAALVVTLFDTLLYEVLAYEPDRLVPVVHASLRVVLGGVGVPSERVEALLVATAPGSDG